MTTTSPHPVALAANQPRQFYRGGAAIADLRGHGSTPELFGPEDWVASTTTRFGQQSEGLSPLPDGSMLRAAIANDPVAWLGEEHVAAFGADPALLVKLLDAGQRLPVHCHPSDAFAGEHFASHFGKTEAWIVIGTEGQEPTVYAGFREAVDAGTVSDWVSSQDSGAMLSALNRVPVRVGDTVLIPSGLPHAIGAGVFVVELQQPTDFSITLEWKDFLATEEQGHLGIGFDRALGALDRSAWSPSRLESLIGHYGGRAGELTSLLPAESRPYFRAQSLTPAPRARLEPEFSVLLVLSGSGELASPDGTVLPLERGSTVVVPYAAGETTVSGELAAVRALPPAPGARTQQEGGAT